MSSLARAYEAMDRDVRRHMDEVNMPGLVYSVTDREKLLRVASFGYSDLSAGRAMDPSLMFEIGSIGKSFTNVALMQLHDEGRLDLHQPVSRYLPWFEVQSDFGPITTHHLMTHTAGLPSGTDIGTHGLYEAWALRHSRTGSAPGEVFRYSNVGYKALGFLLEELDGRSYADCIQTRVLDPLGMRDSHPVNGFETRKREPVAYRRFYDDRPEHVGHGLVPALWTEYGVGDGCQASTAADMAIYLRMLMNGGVGPDGRVISEESYLLMTQRAIATQQWGGAWYGYGLTTADIDGHVYLGHGGSTTGFVAAMIADMDAEIGITVLINGIAESFAAVPLTLHLLSILRAGLDDGAMPSMRSMQEMLAVENASTYVGTYWSGEGRLVVAAMDDRLVLQLDGEEVELQRRGEDTFYAPHPEMDLFLLEFERDGNRAVELFHGPDRYVAEGYPSQEFQYPEEWDAFAGHYRTYNFGLTNFRIIVRKGRLLLVYPGGGHEVLQPMDGGGFRVGEDPRSPETVSFDSVASGQALRAVYSGCPYYRTYTP